MKLRCKTSQSVWHSLVGELLWIFFFFFLFLRVCSMHHLRLKLQKIRKKKQSNAGPGSSESPTGRSTVFWRDSFRLLSRILCDLLQLMCDCSLSVCRSAVLPWPSHAVLWLFVWDRPVCLWKCGSVCCVSINTEPVCVCACVCAHVCVCVCVCVRACACQALSSVTML